ncbi:hypothetical protein [Methylobacterium planeticum]|uniref:Uncharacterized protein n=1 Tax=Methylobacterium planeticum TaxID=2615211 RepID=A0A6N6MAK0_9HYPH|nr:hypothetical protein [Methylobacterium planeticum]KAB1067567.1 hypothetical protein F6X51_27520 [Methylobacterium planeticum]
MQQDIPDVDRTARTIAENVYAAYMRQAEGGRNPQTEQTLLTRLAEAIRPAVPGGTPRDIVDAANRALEAWEQQSGGARGPRVSALDRADGSVGMDVAGV